MFAIIALITSCKTQHVAPIILKDSVSITYKQGQTLTPTLSLIGQGGVEQPSPSGLRGAQTSQFLWNQQRIAGDNNRSYGVATRYDGKPKSLPSGGGAKSAESVESVRDVKIRVDTVFIERWHTQTVPTPPPRGESVGATKFYKDCTKGFWILLILFLGSFGFRIMKAIYLRR